MPALRPHPQLTRVDEARRDDLAPVLSVGRAAWRVTFGPLVGADVVEAGLRRAWAAEVIAGEIEQGWVLVARAHSGVVAMASARPDGDQTFLSRLYVHPGEQHHGVGHLLLGAVCRRAAAPVALTVLSTNQRARLFYERNGFHDNGFEPDPDGGPDHLRMIRAG